MISVERMIEIAKQINENKPGGVIEVSQEEMDWLTEIRNKGRGQTIHWNLNA